MAFDTYTDISASAKQVEDLISQNRSRLDRAKQEISAVVTAMTGIATQYGPIVAAASSMASSDPTNPAKSVLNAHITQLLADFNALQTEASTLDGIVNS